MTKTAGYDFYRTVLKSPKYVVAPMVEQSHLAWRTLSRRHGAQLCYTPMMHARLFADSEKYREQNFDTDEKDRPLIVQFCANDADALLRAAKLVEDKCDAVDLNLGCPQNIAKKGFYGSYLQDEWELIEKMVHNLHENLKVPVTCKIRVFSDPQRTVAYAKMLERAGCQLLTVHGRLREQRGVLTGLADWQQIKLVKESVGIPVFANGNVLYFEDIERCITQTGVDGVMSAEGNLHNPAIFTENVIPISQMVPEFMQLAKDIPTHYSVMKAHLFKLYRPLIAQNIDLRNRLGQASSHSDLEAVVADFHVRLSEFPLEVRKSSEFAGADVREIPSYLLQPYVRPAFVSDKRKLEEEE